VISSSRTFDYSHSSTNWMAPDASPSAKAPTDVPPFWRVNPQDSPMTPAFSPFTPNLHIPPQNWPPVGTDPSPREDLGWSVPQRSISYGNLESLHHQNLHPYVPFQHSTRHPAVENYTTKARGLQSGMYPPPLSTSTSTISAVETSPATTTDTSQHSAGSLPSATYSSWQQPYSYPKPVGSSAESYGGWSSSHGGHPALPEEEHAAPTSYGYGEPASGMYYPPLSHPGR